jgi:hypothetical protein
MRIINHLDVTGVCTTSSLLMRIRIRTAADSWAEMASLLGILTISTAKIGISIPNEFVRFERCQGTNRYRGGNNGGNKRKHTEHEK